MAIQNLPLFDALKAKAEAEAAGIFNPILDMLAKQQADEEAQARAEQQATAQATSAAYAGAREPTAQLYNSAIKQATTVEEAVAARLRGEGGEAGADFARRLAEMGAPQADAQAAANMGKWKDAEGVGYTLGMNDVQRLISRGAQARDFLEKAPGMAEEESRMALAKRIGDLAKDYGGRRDEITSQIPGKVRDIQGDLYNDEWKRREYRDKITADAAAAKAQRQETYMKMKLTLQQLGQTAKLKALDRQFKAQEAAADRQLKIDLNNADNQTKRDTDNPPKPSAKASGPNMKYNPDGSPNPNYNPKGTASGNTPAQQRLREQQANKELDQLMRGRSANGLTNQRSQFVTDSTWSQVAQRVNAILTRNKIGPNTPLGIKLKRAAFGRIGVPTGPRGNPTGKGN